VKRKKLLSIVPVQHGAATTQTCAKSGLAQLGNRVAKVITEPKKFIADVHDRR